MYRFFEIGLRGTAEEVERFGKELKDSSSTNYFWSGRYKSDTQKSYQQYVSIMDDVNLDKVKEIAKAWSLRFSNAESFYYLEDGDRFSVSNIEAQQEIMYGSYSGGHLLSSGVIKTHAEHTRHFGEDSPCDCVNPRTKNDPSFAPYPDCPIRVNPPTLWAVETIVEASEEIGRRR